MPTLKVPLGFGMDANVDQEWYTEVMEFVVNEIKSKLPRGAATPATAINRETLRRLLETSPHRGNRVYVLSGWYESIPQALLAITVNPFLTVAPLVTVISFMVATFMADSFNAPFIPPIFPQLVGYDRAKAKMCIIDAVKRIVAASAGKEVGY